HCSGARGTRVRWCAGAGRHRAQAGARATESDAGSRPEPWAQAVAAQADPLLAYPHTAGARDAQVAAGGAARVRGRSARTDAHAVCGADVAAAAARSVQVDRVGL